MELYEDLSTLPTPNLNHLQSPCINFRRGSTFSNSSQNFSNVSFHSFSSMSELSDNDSSSSHQFNDRRDVLVRPGGSSFFSKIDVRYISRSGNCVMSHFGKKFELIKKIGEGSFGVVFLAKDSHFNQLYALKLSKIKLGVIFPQHNLLNEASNHRKVGSHPNFVKLYSVWQRDLFTCMQFELCSCSLSEFIYSHGPINTKDISWVLNDILNGLKHLHDKNFIHLDLKPENMFISLDSTLIKIGDFGLLYHLTEPLVNAIEGDNRYMAPELLYKNFGKPADIFSLGLTILELVTNMEMPSNGELWHKLRQEELNSLNVNLPMIAKKLVFSMIRTNPINRISLDELHLQLCSNLTTIEKSTNISSMRMFSLIVLYFLSFLNVLINLIFCKISRITIIFGELFRNIPVISLQDIIPNYANIIPQGSLLQRCKIHGTIQDLPATSLQLTSTLIIEKSVQTNLGVSILKCDLHNSVRDINCPVLYLYDSEELPLSDSLKDSSFRSTDAHKPQNFTKTLEFD